jgi:beta-glucosidase-like glycosyl hydrolase
MAVAEIKAVQANGVIAMAKHFRGQRAGNESHDNPGDR